MKRESQIHAWGAWSLRCSAGADQEAPALTHSAANAPDQPRECFKNKTALCPIKWFNISLVFDI